MKKFKNLFNRILPSVSQGNTLAVAAACGVFYALFGAANAFFPSLAVYYLMSAILFAFSTATGIYTRGDARKIRKFGTVIFVFVYLINFGNKAPVSLEFEEIFNRFLIHLVNACIFTSVFAISAIIKTFLKIRKNLNVKSRPAGRLKVNSHNYCLQSEIPTPYRKAWFPESNRTYWSLRIPPEVSGRKRFW